MSPTIGSRPLMDESGFACFEASLKQSHCYLEYGAGSSTVYACNAAKIKTVISVESDQKWADEVRSHLAGTTSNLHLQHCDIGPVSAWGVPVNGDRVQDFWQYMVAPWTIAGRIGELPDTILIDGRFRVAAFLYSLLCARVGTRILFDDYFDRPPYSVVEEFCTLSERHDRMAVFIATKTYSITGIAAKIAQYSVIWT